jgi:hypothetical protein
MVEKSYSVQDIITMISEGYSPDRYMANTTAVAGYEAIQTKYRDYMIG